LRLLLDAHIWIWSQDDPSRLSRRVARKLENPENEKWLSPISVWEFLLLVRKGRLKSPVEDPFHWLERAFSASPTFEATVTHTIAVESERIDVPVRDPADRLIAATAKVLELTLVTADERLMRSRQWKVLPNR
jgi:PIN domain nuclease of toxin-antitoxin system